MYNVFLVRNNQMKIGFSFGRCLGSIVRGEVALADVMCIIARTHMPKQEDVEYVVKEYLHRPGYLAGLDQAECLRVGVELWKTGRIIEPRSNGIHAMQVPQEYIWMDLYPTEADLHSDSVKEAWNSYRMLIQLTEQLPETNDNVLKHGERLVDERPIDPAILNALIM
jgi:hypothetical protein